MEHLVQFTFSVDDNAIQKKLEDHAYDDVIDILVKKATKDLPRKQNWKSEGEINWTYLVEDALAQFIQENRDEVLDMAADRLVERFKRTKAFKEKMSETMEEL